MAHERGASPRTSDPRPEPGTGNPELGTRNPQPRFEVLTTQPQILAEIWANATRVGTAQVVAPVESVAGPLEIDLAPVEVTPVVVKWLVEPAPVFGFPLPFIVRIAAEAARRPE